MATNVRLTGLPPRKALLQAVTAAFEPTLYPQELAYDEAYHHAHQRHERVVVLHEVRDPHEQRDDDADGLHRGPALRLGEPCADEGSHAPANEYGGDVYGGSQPHE